MLELQIAPRTKARRCASCHGDLDTRYVTCRICGTALHADCRRQLLRCPSLGCRGATRAPWFARPAPRPTPATPSRTTPRAPSLPPIVSRLEVWGTLALVLNVSLFFLAWNSENVGGGVFVAFVHACLLPMAMAVLGRKRAGGEGITAAWIVPAATAIALEMVAGCVGFWSALFLLAGSPIKEFAWLVLVALGAAGPAVSGWLAARTSSAS